MKSWRFYGAEHNKSRWVQLDKIINSTDVQGLAKEKTFNINNNNVFKCFKLELISSYSTAFPNRLTLDDFDINGVVLTSLFTLRNSKLRLNIIALIYIIVNKK